MTLFGTGAVTIRSNNTAGNTGVTMAAGAGAWSSLSDRNVKTGIVAINALDVLARVSELPLSTWSYIAQGEGIRHMGPMAQDFRAAFGLGESETSISTIDA
ncbi:MAG: tail fiber domain-containing protein, partial [Ahniella sp.]|nr:tail fiber domain-containing protein [Ahniella sp.]